MLDTLHYSALQTGLAFLPLSVLIAATAIGGGRFTAGLAPRVVPAIGLILTGAGLAWPTQIGPAQQLRRPRPARGDPNGAWPSPMFVLISMHGIQATDAGVASGVLNTAQQGGGSIGVAGLNTIAASSAAAYLTAHATNPGLSANAMLHGYTTVFWIATGLVGAVLLATRLGINARPTGANV